MVQNHSGMQTLKVRICCMLNRDILSSHHALGIERSVSIILCSPTIQLDGRNVPGQCLLKAVGAGKLFGRAL